MTHKRSRCIIASGLPSQLALDRFANADDQTLVTHMR